MSPPVLCRVLAELLLYSGKSRTTGHVQQVTYNTSRTTGHVQHVTYNRSRTICHVQYVTYNMFYIDLLDRRIEHELGHQYLVLPPPPIFPTVCGFGCCGRLHFFTQIMDRGNCEGICCMDSQCVIVVTEKFVL